MPTIIDSLLVTLGLDNAGLKKGAAEADKVQKKLEDNSKKSTKRMSDEERKAGEERKKRAKEQEAQTRMVATAIAKVRNETLGLLGLFAGGVGIKNFIANTVDQAASLKFLSENLDMSVQSIQAYQRASERMGGSAAGMTAQLQESQREIARLKTGQGPSESMQATFRAGGMAGVALNEDDMKNGNTYLMARSRILSVLYKQNAGNAQLMASQMGISQEQFNLIKMGPEALQKLAAAQLKNSMMSTQDTIEMQKLKNQWLDFTDSADATGTKMLVSLIPTFEHVLAWLQKITDYIAAHRGDIAKWIDNIVPKILEAADAFGKFLANMDWKGIIEDAKVLVSALVSIANAAEAVMKFFGPKEKEAKIDKRATEKLNADTDREITKYLSGFAGGRGGAPGVAPGATSNNSTNNVSIVVNTLAKDPIGVANAVGSYFDRNPIVNFGVTGMK